MYLEKVIAEVILVTFFIQSCAFLILFILFSARSLLYLVTASSEKKWHARRASV